jgi:hypothetical protein
MNMRIAGYLVDYRKDVITKMGAIGTVDLEGNPLPGQDCWKVHIHVKSFNISKDKFRQVSNYIINYLFEEGYITMDIPVKFRMFDVLGKDIHVNQFDKYGNDTQG